MGAGRVVAWRARVCVPQAKGGGEADEGWGCVPQPSRCATFVLCSRAWMVPRRPVSADGGVPCTLTLPVARPQLSARAPSVRHQISELWHAFGTCHLHTHPCSPAAEGEDTVRHKLRSLHEELVERFRQLEEEFR